MVGDQVCPEPAEGCARSVERVSLVNPEWLGAELVQPQQQRPRRQRNHGQNVAAYERCFHQRLRAYRGEPATDYGLAKLSCRCLCNPDEPRRVQLCSPACRSARRPDGCSSQLRRCRYERADRPARDTRRAYGVLSSLPRAHWRASVLTLQSRNNFRTATWLLTLDNRTQGTHGI